MAAKSGILYLIYMDIDIVTGRLGEAGRRQISVTEQAMGKVSIIKHAIAEIALPEINVMCLTRFHPDLDQVQTKEG